MPLVRMQANSEQASDLVLINHAYHLAVIFLKRPIAERQGNTDVDKMHKRNVDRETNT